MSQISSLGEDLRALRTGRKLTLEEVAAHLNRSVGWLSQVERGISQPHMEDLRQFSSLFDVPLSLFFGIPDAPENERGRIVRSGARRTIGQRESGLLETLISPDLTDSFEMIHSTFQPGSSSGASLTRPTQEIVYLVSGKLDIWLQPILSHKSALNTDKNMHDRNAQEEGAFTLQAGDSFRVRGESLRWANPYSEPAVAIWCISPPVY